MAVYNELQVGRYVRFLQKFFSIKGRQPAPLSFSGELGAFLSLFHGAENRYLEGWNFFLQNYSQSAGGAGTNAAAQLRNPSGSNVVAVVTSLIAVNSSNAADAPQVSFKQNAVAADDLTTAVVIATPLDNRWKLQVSNLITTRGTPVSPGTLGSGLAQLSFPVNGQASLISYVDQEITLLPGDAIRISSNVANQQLIPTFGWRERSLEESERA